MKTWRGTETAPPAAHIGRHRRPRPISVDEARIPTVYLNDVVRHMRSDALTLDPTRLGPGFDIDHAMQRAGDDAEAALMDWRVAS